MQNEHLCRSELNDTRYNFVELNRVPSVEVSQIRHFGGTSDKIEAMAAICRYIFGRSISENYATLYFITAS